MNICITDNCNNNCKFCFQHNNVGRHDMSLSDVKKIVAWAQYEPANPVEQIGVMGGEPTIAKNFIPICEWLVAFGVPLFVITNLLCAKDITRYLAGVKKLALLVNIFHPSQKNALFEDNMKYLVSEGDCRLILSVILGNKDDDEHTLAYTEYLLARFPIKGIRISQVMPNYRYDICSNSSFASSLVKLLKIIARQNTEIYTVFDCAINSCLLPYGVLAEVIFNNKNVRTVCEYPNIDIRPDFSCSWCACFNEKGDPLYIDNIFAYPNFEALLQELFARMAKFQAENSPACDYKNCNRKECFGLCPGVSYVKTRREFLIAKRFHKDEE